MERLTKWVDGEWRENHDNETQETKNKNDNRACMTKLAEYEDIDKTPKQIVELIEIADYKMRVAEGIRRTISNQLDHIIDIADCAARSIGSLTIKELILRTDKKSRDEKRKDETNA